MKQLEPNLHRAHQSNKRALIKASSCVCYGVAHTAAHGGWVHAHAHGWGSHGAHARWPLEDLFAKLGFLYFQLKVYEPS